MRSRNLLEAFRFALSGLWYTLCTQRNMRIHLVIAGVVTAVGIWLQLSAERWAIIVLTSALVLISEMTNTVIENLVDLVCPEYHPLARVVKDVMAGAVVLAAAVAVIVGLLVIGPPLWSRLAG